MTLCFFFLSLLTFPSIHSFQSTCTSTSDWRKGFHLHSQSHKIFFSTARHTNDVYQTTPNAVGSVQLADEGHHAEKSHGRFAPDDQRHAPKRCSQPQIFHRYVHFIHATLPKDQRMRAQPEAFSSATTAKSRSFIAWSSSVSVKRFVSSSDARHEVIFSYVEQQILRNSSSKTPASSFRREPSDLQSSSISSFPMPLESKSDPTFDRMRQIQTAQSSRTHSEVAQSGKAVNPRTKLDRLALAKGTRINPAGTAHIRASRDHRSARRALIGRLDEEETVSSSKVNSTVDDVRFRSLVGTFAEVHQAKESPRNSVEAIVRSNTSLHDPEGRWKSMNNRASIAERAQLKHRRQMLIEQLHKNIDIFLIEVAA